MKRGQHHVLCVDDDSSVLNSLKRLLRKEDYRLLTTTSTSEALSIMNDFDVSLIISDQRLQEESGIEFLASVKDKHPDTVRVVLSGYTNIDTITEAINKGHIYKMILKPWNDQKLKLDIRQSLEQYELLQTNKELHKTIIDQNEELKTINENLERLVRERTKDLEIQYKALELTRAMLDDLPYPVIGVSSEMMIVYKNKKSCSLTDINSICIGSRTSESFSEELEEKISHVLETSQMAYIADHPFCGKKYNFKICALSNHFEGKGIVMTLVESDSLNGARL